MTEATRKLLYARLVADYFFAIANTSTNYQLIYGVFVEGLTTLESGKKYHYPPSKSISIIVRTTKRCNEYIKRALVYKEMNGGGWIEGYDFLDLSNWVHPLRRGRAQKAYKPKVPINVPMSTSIVDMDLNYRTKRILWWLNATTLKDVINLDLTEVSKIRSCNTATIADIKRELQRFGL